METGTFVFYGCKLRVQIGDHKPGTLVGCIIFSNECAYIQLQFGDLESQPEKTEDYQLLVKVGNRLK